MLVLPKFWPFSHTFLQIYNNIQLLFIQTAGILGKERDRGGSGFGCDEFKIFVSRLEGKKNFPY